MPASVAGIHGGLDTHANRPAGNAVPDGSLYSCSTHSLIYKSNYTGNSWATYATLGGGTTVATDTIWDAAGDTVVGSGADTAARLAIGNVGGALRRINGTVQWDSRTSMPTAATGDVVYRSDLSGQWFYNGSIWMSLAADQMAFPLALALPLTAGGAAHRMAMPQALGGSDIYLATITFAYYVDGGTALDGSNKWVGTYNKTGGVTSTSLGTCTINSGASSQWLVGAAIAINAAAVPATYFAIEGDWVKTGTPGNLYINAILSFRTIAT